MEEIIQKYISNKLSDSERKHFESQLEVDPSLNGELMEMKQLSQAIHLRERNLLKNKLTEYDKSEELSKPNGRHGLLHLLKSNKIFKYGIAASLVIFSGIMIQLYFFQSETPDNLFTQYYAPFPNVVSPSIRGDVSGVLSVEEINAFNAYEAEDYEKAITLFTDLPQKGEVMLYTGISYLAINDAKKAKGILSSVTLQNHQFHSETYRLWYLALTYLKLDEINSCKKILNDLSKTNNPQRAKAKDLLDKL